MSDMVNHPPHYKAGGIEAIDVIEAFGLDFCCGNAVKYILRADRKGDALENLRKAAWYIARAIEKRSPEYDAQKDLGGSLNDGYAAIRERVANGGPEWERKGEVSTTKFDDCQRETLTDGRPAYGAVYIQPTKDDWPHPNSAIVE